MCSVLYTIVLQKLVAFTEYGDRPLLIVYDLESNKRRKVLRCAEFKSKEVISLAFSHDSKYLLAQGSEPDFQLVYFFWEKGKVITTSKTVTSSAGSVTEVSYNPKDHDVVCIIGKGIFRMCRLIEGKIPEMFYCGWMDNILRGLTFSYSPILWIL